MRCSAASNEAELRFPGERVVDQPIGATPDRTGNSDRLSNWSGGSPSHLRNHTQSSPVRCTLNTADDGYEGTAPSEVHPAQRLWPLQRGRQRMGVVRRLVHVADVAGDGRAGQSGSFSLRPVR